MNNRKIQAAAKTVLLASLLTQPPSSGAGDFDDCRVASEEELSEMRGGFELNNGDLRLNFSIDKVTIVNGVMTSVTSLTLPSTEALASLREVTVNRVLESLPSTISINPNGSPTVAAPTNTAAGTQTPAATSAGAPVPSGTANLVPVSSGSSVPASTPGIAAAPGNIAQPLAPSPPNLVSNSVNQVVQATASANPSAGTSAPAPAPAASTGSVTLVQNGANNTFVLPEGLNLSTAGLTTIVQNTLDNQTITTATVINATLTNQALARSLSMTFAINQALAKAIH